ncbi:MAG: DNA polymerase III subunit alpha [Candidatus Abawacabacteria bacterium]|nr:DNA polymerase III subunit alpha [Candidatus Abawacabacteria bacterium]
MAFVHLHVHSHYSLLDALGSPYAIIGRVKELHMDTIALTDSGVMYGAVDFYQAAKGYNIKAILGAELYVAHRSRFDRSDEERKPYQLVLLAESNQGYENLMQLVTKGQLEGSFEKPLIDWDLLHEFHQGLIALSGDYNGELGQAIIHKSYNEAKKVAEKYQDLFGKNNYFIELNRHGLEVEKNIEQQLLTIAQELTIQLVATNNSHYPTTNDREAHDALICVKNQKLISDPNRPRYDGNYAILSEEEMRALFSDIPQACDITNEIAARCNIEIALGRNLLPPFQCPPGLTVPEYLYELCIEGAKKRYGDPLTEEIIKRIDYELGIINKTGFPSYFLIVWDFIHWAKTHGVAVGPGRGSAAGAMVTYVLGITDIDPLEHDLVFERFLNPERVSPPDIDIDFADDSRERVINYVVEKYGRDCVAQIITFGTMGAKAAIRDVGRVLGCGYKEVDILAKLIPTKPGTKMKDAIEQEPLLKETLEKNLTHKQIWDLALKLEGVVRHASTHASAVVISGEPLVQYSPLQKNTAGKEEGIVTQYAMKPLEALGLLKMDFLGLRNLTVLADTAKIIAAHYHVDLDWQHLDTQDESSYQLLAQGKTTGVFQLESQGMKHYLKELKPTNFEDIIAMISLYRPGPLEAIPDFIAAKNGQKEVTYLDPELEPILKKTYGVIVYQEQVLEIARQFCGFSYGEADILRRAVGKKIKELLMEQRQKFIDKAHARGKAKEVAEKIWDFIEPFARYGFNKSHAACYAMIAYQTAYLKSHYPAAFMAALLSCDRGDTERIVIEIEEAKILGLTIHPPSINNSEVNFMVENENDIRFALGAIKNLGDVPAGHIVTVRKQGGIFTSLQNFLERIDPSMLNRKSLEALIKANAFIDLAPADILMHNLDDLVGHLAKLRKVRDTPADSLFGEIVELNLPPFKLAPLPQPISQQEVLHWEKEALGLYLSAHPLDHLKASLAKETPRLDQINLNFEGKKIKVSGMIMQMKRILTKNGSSMCFIELENPFGKIEGIIFAKAMEACQENCQEDALVTASGTISFRDRRSGGQSDTAKFLIDSLTPLVLKEDKVKKHFHRQEPYTIQVPASITSEQLSDLKQVLSKFPGTIPVQLELVTPLHKSTIIHLPDHIDLSSNFRQTLQAFHAQFSQ